MIDDDVAAINDMQAEIEQLEARLATLTAALARYQEKDGLRTREHNLLVTENRALRAAIESALRRENSDDPAADLQAIYETLDAARGA